MSYVECAVCIECIQIQTQCEIRAGLRFQFSWDKIIFGLPCDFSFVNIDYFKIPKTQSWPKK